MIRRLRLFLKKIGSDHHQTHRLLPPLPLLRRRRLHLVPPAQAQAHDAGVVHQLVEEHGVARAGQGGQQAEVQVVARVEDQGGLPVVVFSRGLACRVDGRACESIDGRWLCVRFKYGLAWCVFGGVSGSVDVCVSIV